MFLSPPSAELQVRPKPTPPANIVTSAKAEADYNVAVEAWGETGWQQVARLCRWAKGHGAAVECPE